MSPRDRRTAIVGMTVIATLFAVARGLPALIGWQQRQTTEVAELSNRASSARAGLRLLPLVHDSLRVRRIRLAALDSALLQGASAPAAAAELAASLDEMAVEARLKITAMQLRADTIVSGALSRVAVRINGTTDVAGLAAFLRAVEGDATPLVVRELSVTQPEPAAVDARVETLHVDILVEGLARIGPRES